MSGETDEWTKMQTRESVVLHRSDEVAHAWLLPVGHLQVVHANLLGHAAGEDMPRVDREGGRLDNMSVQKRAQFVASDRIPACPGGAASRGVGAVCWLR
jgi:hypothetical protein